MALGRREAVQAEMLVAATELPRSPGHVFYTKLNALLAEADFDRRVEALCEPYYADDVGRPGIPPGVYFRMLFVGFFEGLGSQRAIAWKCADSLSVRDFLGVPAGQGGARSFEPDLHPPPVAVGGVPAGLPDGARHRAGERAC